MKEFGKMSKLIKILPLYDTIDTFFKTIRSLRERYESYIYGLKLSVITVIFRNYNLSNNTLELKAFNHLPLYSLTPEYSYSENGELDSETNWDNTSFFINAPHFKLIRHNEKLK